MYESGGMKILTKVSSMLGLMMMGSMTALYKSKKTIAPNGEPVLANEIPIPAAITRKMPQKKDTTWFNATMHINNFIMGLVASMEKQNSEDENFDGNRASIKIFVFTVLFFHRSNEPHNEVIDMHGCVEFLDDER
jgi:mannose/fructose/N-acetylgalactosamine-specific phosphotransferase system component IID